MASESDDDDDSNTNLLLTLLAEENEKDDLNSKNPNPQQQLDQLHRLQSIGATLAIRQLPSQGLSFQLWPAASTLVSLLDRNPSSLLLPPAPRLNILELGSGTGLVGIASAAILGAHVTLTDLPHVLPNLHFNAQANAGVIAARGGAVAVRQLTWGNEEDSSSVSSSLFHVVMASDVVYHDHLIDPLLQTLSCFVKGEAAFVMAHLRRWKKRDSVFFRKARKMFDVAVVHRDPPSPGSRIGVAVYRFTAKKNAS